MSKNNFICWFICIVCLSGCGGVATPAPTATLVPTAEVASVPTSCQTLTVSEADNWYPLFLVDPETQAATGVGVDLIQKLAADLKLDLVIKTNIPWKRQLVMLEEGQLDVILGAYWNKERSNIYLYTEPFMEDNITVFVMKGHEFPLDDFSDLKGKSGSAPAGWSLGEAFDQYAKDHLHLERAADNAAIFQKLLAGYSDYAISAYWDGTAYLQQENLMGQIVPLSYTIATNEVHLLVSRRSPCQNHVEAINQLLKKYRQEGVIEAMLNQYRAK